MKPYLEHRDDIVKTIKNNPLKEAVKRIDEYLSDPEVIFSFFFLNFNKRLSCFIFRQKFKANADMPSEEESEDTDTAFNKLRESDDSPELETPKATVTMKTKKASQKKKSVRSSPPLKFRFEKKVNHFAKFI